MIYVIVGGINITFNVIAFGIKASITSNVVGAIGAVGTVDVGVKACITSNVVYVGAAAIDGEVVVGVIVSGVIWGAIDGSNGSAVRFTLKWDISCRYFIS